MTRRFETVSRENQILASEPFGFVAFQGRERGICV